jgi:cytochrome o ubiquinol oxidase subunit 1
MSTLETSPELLAAPADDRLAPGVTRSAAWLISSDHKVIGRMFIGVSLLALLGVLAVALILGIERIDGGDAVFDQGAMTQLFTAQRVGLLYGVVLPLLLGLAIAIVPLQLGARSLAFPRVAAAGFWAWLAGLVLLAISLAADGGPLGSDSDMVDLFIAAHGLVLVGLLAAATSVATSVLTTRAPGMRLERAPFYSWAALVVSAGLILALPVLLGNVIYTFVDHRYAGVVFGGNAGLGAWLGFGWTQPTTYLFALPAFGLLAELAPVTFQKRTPMRGIAYTGLGLVGVAALGAVSQRHHLVAWDGSFGDKLEDLGVWAFFLLLPVLGALMVMGTFALVAKPTKGGPGPRLNAAFLFAFFGAGLVLAGMLAGALTNIIDLNLQGTVFEEGALLLVGYGAILAGLGGLAYWTPKWSGHLVADKPAMGLALLGALGTALAAGPLLIAGFADQPALATEFDYDGPAELWNVLSMIGHALVALTLLAFAGLFVKALTQRSEPADADPWGGQTLEWLTTSPAPVTNFAEPPTVMSPEPAYDLRATPDRGRAD